jgi:hypothetical protein
LHVLAGAHHLRDLEQRDVAALARVIELTVRVALDGPPAIIGPRLLLRVEHSHDVLIREFAAIREFRRRRRGFHSGVGRRISGKLGARSDRIDRFVFEQRWGQAAS